MFFRCFSAVVAVAVTLIASMPLHSQIVQDPLTPAEIQKNWKSAGWSTPSGWKPVTKESDAIAWGRKLSEAIESKDLKQFSNELFDSDQLLADSVREISDGKYKTGFQQGVNSAMQNNLASMVTAADFSVRRVRNTKYGPTVLTRMLNEDGTVAYVLWRLVKNRNGDVKSVDMLSLGVGEWTSHTLARAAVLNMPQEASFLQKLSGTQLAISNAQKRFLKMAEAQSSQDFESVLSQFQKLPADLKKEKFIQLMRLNAAMQVNDEQYMDAINSFKKAHPNDVASSLHSIDFHFLKEDFAKMQAAIDAILEQIGPDSHLYNLKAVGYSSAKKYAQAVAMLQLAIKTEPKREDNYWSLIETSLKAGDLDTVTATLKTLVVDFGFEEFDFEAADVYKPFIGSPQHKDFMKFLTRRARNQ